MMWSLRRACTNRSIHLLFSTAIALTVITITFDYGKASGRNEVLDMLLSGRVTDFPLDSPLLNKYKASVQRMTTSSRSTTEGSDAIQVWKPLKVAKSLKPEEKQPDKETSSATRKQSNDSSTGSTTDASDSKTISSLSKSKSEPQTSDSKPKATDSKSKGKESPSKSNEAKSTTKKEKTKSDEMKPKENPKQKPKPKPPVPVTIKPIEKKGPPRLPNEIIDVDKVYPGAPPEVTWHDDVLIQLPKFDHTKPVPNVLHLAWYSSKKRGTELKLHHYISFLSAYKRLKPKRILFWYDERPTGSWWETIANTTKSVLQLVKRASPREIFGHPIVVPEHHSDVVRLEAVMYYGGVYIDLDVIVLKDFAPLYKYNTTMGYEVSYGLCNGIIVSKAAAPFLMIWYDRYRTFDDSVWSEHSVMLPARLAKQNPTLIHTEATSMHKPYWGELKKIYNEGVYFNWTNNYSIHLWYRLHGREHTIEEINKMNTTYGQISRYTLYDSPAIIKKPPSISKMTKNKT